MTWPAPETFEGRGPFCELMQRVLTAAAHQGCPRMWWVAPTFAEWPVDRPEVLEVLSAWARSGRVQLVWICSDFEGLRRTHPRLVAWRRQFDHVLSCLRPEEVASSDLPTTLLAGSQGVLRLLDPAHWRGYWRTEPGEVSAMHHLIDAISQRSSVSFPATTLGI